MFYTKKSERFIRFAPKMNSEGQNDNYRWDEVSQQLLAVIVLKTSNIGYKDEKQSVSTFTVKVE